MVARSKARKNAPAMTPPRAVAPSRTSQDRMILWAMLASLLIHGVLLSIHFRLPEKLARQKDRGLEVILVNARHARAPEKPEALAQANLDGGGNTDKNIRAKTPLPAQDRRREGDALLEAQRRVQQLEAAQREMLTRIKSKLPVAVDEQKQEQEPPEAPTPVSGLDLLDSAAAIARLEAQIDKDMVEYSKRPRRKFIGARTREYRFAQYVEDWRQKIERVGTLNYPEAARGRVYGSLLLSVVIKADGSVDSIEVHRSSGYKVLDEAAQRIVRLASPFAAFPPDIRKDTDIIEITRTWNFTSADRVQAE